MGDDDWVSTEINSDSRDFELDKNEAEKEWLDEDSNNDEDEDEDGDEDDQPNNNEASRIVEESEPRLHEPS